MRIKLNQNLKKFPRSKPGSSHKTGTTIMSFCRWLRFPISINLSIYIMWNCNESPGLTIVSRSTKYCMSCTPLIALARNKKGFFKNLKGLHPTVQMVKDCLCTQGHGICVCPLFVVLTVICSFKSAAGFEFNTQQNHRT